MQQEYLIRKITFLFIFSVFLSSSAYAQKEESEVKAFITDFTEAYSDLPKSKNVESVTKYVSKSLYSTIINANVIGNFGLIQSDYVDFENYLMSVVQNPEITLVYKIQSFEKVYVRGVSAVVVCDIESQVARSGVIWQKTNETTSFVLKKNKNGWQILSFNVVSIEEELNRGTCLCELFAASTGNYISKSTVPTGETYTTNIDDFQFTPKPDGMIYIQQGDHYYSWIRDGALKKMNGSAEDELLGTAIDEIEAIMQILSKDLYSEECTNFKRRR